MAAWVQAGNRKVNLERAVWIDRTDDGAVHVIFDGALNHTFYGPAAQMVWEYVVARDAEAPPAKPGKLAVVAAKAKRVRRTV